MISAEVSEKEKILAAVDSLVRLAKEDYESARVAWSAAKPLTTDSIQRWECWNRYVEKTARLSALYSAVEKINAVS